jgi:hypothetical protein
MIYIYDHLLQDYGAVTFEAFINLLVCLFIVSSKFGGSHPDIQVDILEDQTTPDQLREAFRGIASDKVCVNQQGNLDY